MPKANSTGIFVAQYYESEESLKSPYAVTPEEGRWRSTAPQDYKRALATAKEWGERDGAFKASRVIELNKEGVPISVAWASAWEAPLQAKKESGSSGAPGVSCKIMVWENREVGPPDHWDWVGKFGAFIGLASNSWDFEYGREVATRGRMSCYSIKLNIWPAGKKKPPEKWNWWEFFGKDPVMQRDEVEFVRSHAIEPREFPAGSETVECAFCGKLHLRSRTWMAYNPDTDENEFFDRCRCIDDHIGEEDVWRMDPDGEEHEQCVEMARIEA